MSAHGVFKSRSNRMRTLAAMAAADAGNCMQMRKHLIDICGGKPQAQGAANEMQRDGLAERRWVVTAKGRAVLDGLGEK
jgi:hypothetical protein